MRQLRNRRRAPNQRWLRLVLAAMGTVLAVALTACSSGSSGRSGSPAASFTTASSPADPPASATAAPSATPTAAPTAAPSPVSVLDPRIKRIFVVILENESGTAAIRDPYLAQLAKRGASLTQYHAVGHPSLPNYLAMIAGAVLVHDDEIYNLPQTNLVDLLEPAHRSWKSYQEAYPGGCFTGAAAGTAATGTYVRKHNPFMSFDNIRTNPARCARIVPATQLDTDIAQGQLPDFGFYTPTLENDGHDTSVTFAASWLRAFLEPKLANPKFSDGTLVVVTFDEGTGDPSRDPIYTVLLGPMVAAGSVDATTYTHYSLLRTIEEAFGLGTLGREDAKSVPFATCNFARGC